MSPPPHEKGAGAPTDEWPFATFGELLYTLKQVRPVSAHRSDLRGLRNVLLATRDAHRLYARYGFTSLAEPERWMAIRRPYRG